MINTSISSAAIGVGEAASGIRKRSVAGSPLRRCASRSKSGATVIPGPTTSGALPGAAETTTSRQAAERGLSSRIGTS
jgi:hypothetical protein